MKGEKRGEDARSRLRDRAEELLGSEVLDEENIAALSTEDIGRLVHNLRVHQVELEMQNEDLRQAQLQLEELKDRYLDLYDFAPIGYLTLDRKGLVRESNLTAARLLGVDRKRLIGTFFSRFVCEAESGAWYLHLQQAFETHSKQTCEIRLTQEDGMFLHAHLETVPVEDEQGVQSRCRTMVLDITERKRAEEARDRLAAAVEQAAEAVVITDAEGNILYVNPVFETTTGYQSEEAVGATPRILKSGHHDETFYKRMWDTISSGQVWTGHIINRKKDGTLFEEDATISPVRDDAGRIVNYVGIKRDVTKEISLQTQLLQAQKMEAVGTLAGGVAHDFNNILQVALGFSELMLNDERLPAIMRADIQKIYESARRGADLVKRLLTFGRKTEIKPQPLNLNRRIRELRKMLDRTLPKMIEIQLCLGENLDAINADPVQIDQILMNLAVNARDAMPDGGALAIETANVVLDEEYAGTHLDAAPGRHVLLSVTDTGSGMNSETMEHIFEPFFTTKAVGQGTGLGLAVVHGIVQQHGGHIACFSAPGNGTEFRIYFPALASEGEWEEGIDGAMQSEGTETILLVEDDEFIRDLGSRILAKAGYEVLAVSTGEEALEVYRQRGEEIGLVVMDLIMPEMGGKQCLEGLLRLNPSVKVIVASGYSAEESTKEALEAGAAGFVHKPYNVRQMLSAVRNLLDRQ